MTGETSNFANRTLWTGDNLHILRGMNSGCIDLIYLDPPFNSNQNYAAPIGSKAAGAAFKDTWTLDDLDVAWTGLIADEQPAVAQLLKTAGLSHGTGMQSYLTMMAVRLIEMHRVLKDTGSIYLHCDPTAGHYIKLLMDSIFGHSNFRNEIVWKRTAGRSDANGYGRVHDTILFYCKTETFTWKTQWLPHSEEYVRRTYTHHDARGPWQPDQLTASGLRFGQSGEPWRGVDPGHVGNHWRTPTQGGMNAFIVEHDIIPGWPEDYPTVHSRLDALDAVGLIYWPEGGNQIPRLKRYLESTKGTAVEDIFSDIKRLEGRSNERVGYPTQKPLALLERIIKASSNEGDVVLDPFCGCATACVAAERLERNWVGIDISPKAIELVKQRLEKPQPLGIGPLFHKMLVIPRTDVPQRTDIDAPKNYRQNRHVLFGQQEGFCAGCKIDFPFKIFEVDHKIPKTRGGTDHIENLQLLCPNCNRIKGNRPMEYLITQLQTTGVNVL